MKNVTAVYALRAAASLNVQTYIVLMFCSWLSILLMMTYTGTVIVILLNILIAQLSTTYMQDKKIARLEYSLLAWKDFLFWYATKWTC